LNQRIIVNCARGISRSATIVIAYLMYRYKMRLDEAYELLIKLRPQVRPNSNFRYQLKLYEQELISNRYYNTNVTSVMASSSIKNNKIKMSK
jgi:protein-tyrosine phosphatase